MVKETFILEDVTVSLDGNRVGGCQSMTVVLNQNNEAKHEAGSKFPFYIRPGQATVTGSVGRLFLDSEQIKSTVDLEEGNNPSFTLTGVTKNKNPERILTVEGAVFSGFNINMNLNSDTEASQDYIALRVRFN